MSDANRPTWTEINLDNLVFNFKHIKKFVGANLKFMAVVKADGYGHGAVECARKLEQADIDWFGVALPEEGLELRENSIKKPILCLGSFWAGQENLLLENDLTQVIYRLDLAEKFNRAAQAKKIAAAVHIKIDTGMNRIGVRFDEVEDFAESLKRLTNLRVEGIMTHFATADNLREKDFTNQQIKRFETAAAIFEEKGFRPRYKDLANSPAAVAHKDSYGNMVRIGGILYGLGDDVLPPEVEKPQLKPVLSLHTRIAHLKNVPKGETVGYSRTFTTKRDSLIATIPIGYQDGLPRRLSNQGRVLINGDFARVVGRISMDWTILDVTDVPNIQINDEVILIGEKNDKKITAAELARLTETISYEITCGIDRRVTRIYVGS